MGCPQDLMKNKDKKLSLKVDGKEIPIVPFVHDAFRDMIIAFTENLKGHEGGKIEITIDK